ncbi:MAG TPA: S-adenosylmethionine:tRNA ribosyltransferase-isomerase [Ohtaekwangia sp.]
MNTYIDINDYTYTLPADRIALFPLASREQSKLLVYKAGKIEHHNFYSVGNYLPDNTSLFFNDTKVIPARLYFLKDTGATIEVFLLSPVKPSALLIETMQAKGNCSWKCTIGNLKRWPRGLPLTKLIGDITLKANLLHESDGIVEFTWSTDHTFAEILNRSGETPLPPYLKRQAESSDRERYQTVYAQYEGAVAAPTAGLHFTPEILDQLKRNGITTDFLTLHVSAGTFQPVKVDNAAAHTMHNEQVLVSRENVEHLLDTTRFVIPVGTTSLRTLESLYWYGVKLLRDPEADFIIEQNFPYRQSALPDKQEALTAVWQHMKMKDVEVITGNTSIYIVPGYTFKIINGLITNFHQPGSTLMLLVASLVGTDWKKIYSEALENNYRFLSYGDSSLLLP